MKTIQVDRILPAFVDDRGAISDIVVDRLDAVTIVTTRGGAIRGNHYHTRTVQYMYMISGRMRYTAAERGRPARSVTLEPGDLVVTLPHELHAMRALEDTVFLAMARGPRAGAGFESDTVRLADDEALERPDAR